jgi:hypothetical protein
MVSRASHLGQYLGCERQNIQTMKAFEQSASGKMRKRSRGNLRTRLNLSRRIAVGWNVSVNFLAPVGYEDESGFHYNTQTLFQRSLT